MRSIGVLSERIGLGYEETCRSSKREHDLAKFLYVYIFLRWTKDSLSNTDLLWEAEVGPEGDERGEKDQRRLHHRNLLLLVEQ